MSGVLAAMLVSCGGTDLQSDHEPTCTPSQTLTTVVSTLRLPTATADGAFDIDGDSSPDNGLAKLDGALTLAGFDSQGALDAAVASGHAPLLVAADTSDATFANDTCAEVTLAIGVAAPGITFNGQDQLAKSSTVQPITIGGTITNNVFTSTPPSGSRHAIPLTLAIAGTLVVIPINAVHVRFTVDATADTLTAGAIGGAILATDIAGTLLPTMATQLTAEIAQGGANADAVTALFDTGGQAGGSCTTTCHDATTGTCAGIGDGRIDACELAGNGLLATLLVPDVTILDPTGQVAPDHFRQPHDALSLGLTFEAVAATY